MRVFVAGGTGVVGRPLVELLVGQGHAVTFSTRRPDGAGAVEALGARAVVMDGLDEIEVHQTIIKAEPDVVVNQMTSLAVPATDYGTWLAVTNRLRSEGTKYLMSAAREAGSHRVVAQSASFMTRPGPGPTDESAPLYLDGPGPIADHIRANLAAEELVLSTDGIEGLVLRYGFLYGDGTSIGPGGDIANAVKAGAMPIAGEGTGRYPFIHVRDAVAVTAQAVARGAAGVYNIVDDEPAAQAEWLPYLAKILDAPPPRRMAEDEVLKQFGVQAVYYGIQLPAAANTNAKAALGFAPQFPSWRDGFRNVFG